MAYKSLLKNGLVPERTVCPFRKECGIAQAGTCGHQGEKHGVSYSCAAARSFDLIAEHKVSSQD
jgi:hypothetical protein